MKKFLLALALLLSFTCVAPVPTHACEGCEEATVEKFETEEVNTRAASCPCGGATKTVITYGNYELQKKVQCSHASTNYVGYDYVYKRTKTTKYVCNSCGTVLNTVTTTETKTSCNKKL